MGIKKSRFLAQMLSLLLIIQMFIYPFTTINAETVFKQNGEADQGGFQSGAYDPNAVQPTPYNWVRQSGYSGPAVPEENWGVEFPGKTDRSHTSMAVGSDNTIYIVVLDDILREDWTTYDTGTLFYFIEGDPTQVREYSPDSEPLLSPPVIGANGLLYIGGRGKIFAIDISKLKDDSIEDKLAWTFVSDDSEEEFEKPAAIGADGTVYFPSDKGVLYALSEDGTLKWKFTSQNAYPHLFLTPVIDDNGYIYVTESSSTSTIYALDSDSQLIHKLDIDSQLLTPVISSDGLIYAPSRGKDMYVIDTESFVGQTVTAATYIATTSNGKSITSSAAVGPDGKVYASGYGRLYELDPTVFQDVYTDNDTMNLLFESGSGNETSPPLLDKEGNIYLVELRDGIVYRFEKDETDSTGWRKSWEFINDKLTYSDFGEGRNYLYYSFPAIDSNGNLLLASEYRGSRTSMLFSIGPDTTGPFPDQSSNLWFESPVWVNDDKIFILFNEKLDTNFLPDVSAFTVSDHGIPINVTGVEIADNEYSYDPYDPLGGPADPDTVLVLNLDQKVINGQQVVVSFQSDSQLRDLKGNLATSFSNMVAFDMTSPEVIDGQIVDGNVALAFDEEIWFVFNSTQLATDKNLTVSVNGVEAVITNVAASGDTLVLQLDNPVQSTDSVKVTYHNRGLGLFDLIFSSQENLIQDTRDSLWGGNLAVPFTDYPVTLWGNDRANTIEGNVDVGDTVSYSTDNGASWQAYDLNNPVKFTGDQSVYVRVNGGTPKPITFTQLLDRLTVNPGTLNPAFDPAVLDYTVTVVDSSEITITTAVYDDDTTIFVNNEEYLGGTDKTIQLNEGSNVVTITLKAVGAPDKTYTIDFIRSITPPPSSGSGDRDRDLTTDETFNLDDIEQNNGEFSLTFTDGRPRVEVMIPVDVIEEWKAQYPDGLIRMTTSDASFVLPFIEMNLEELLSNLAETAGQGEEYYVKITIAVVEDEEKTEIEHSAEKYGVETLGKAVDFRVEIVTDGDSVIWVPGGEVVTDGRGQKELKTFSGYVLRSIFIDQDHLNSEKTVAVLYDPETQEFYPVPTRMVSLEDGRTEVKFQRPGLSIYTVLQHEKTFDDIQNHWAKNDIEILSNKLIVKGRNEATFDPNGTITRAEFSALLVRALGLQGLKTDQEIQFTDTRTTDWYYEDLQVAVNTGLIQGYGDQTFRPMNNITREEMAVMLNRALAFIGEETNVTEMERVLSGFVDSGQVSSFAVNHMANIIDKEIIKGKGNRQLAPKDHATRAEVVAMIKRFLEYVDFL